MKVRVAPVAIPAPVMPHPSSKISSQLAKTLTTFAIRATASAGMSIPRPCRCCLKAM